MAVVDSRVRGGVLKFTATGSATAKDFSCQATSVAVVPGVNEEDAKEVLCGDKVGGGSTTDDRLQFTVISDHASADGLIAFSWLHRGETVHFEFAPDHGGKSWSGSVIDQALTVGGAVGEQLLIEGDWKITAVTPPTGYGDGQIHTTPTTPSAGGTGGTGTGTGSGGTGSGGTGSA